MFCWVSRIPGVPLLSEPWSSKFKQLSIRKLFVLMWPHMSGSSWHHGSPSTLLESVEFLEVLEVLDSSNSTLRCVVALLALLASLSGRVWGWRPRRRQSLRRLHTCAHDASMRHVAVSVSRVPWLLSSDFGASNQRWEKKRRVLGPHVMQCQNGHNFAWEGLVLDAAKAQRKCDTHCLKWPLAFRNVNTLHRPLLIYNCKRKCPELRSTIEWAWGNQFGSIRDYPRSGQVLCTFSTLFNPFHLSTKFPKVTIL